MRDELARETDQQEEKRWTEKDEDATRPILGMACGPRRGEDEQRQDALEDSLHGQWPGRPDSDDNRAGVVVLKKEGGLREAERIRQVTV